MSATRTPAVADRVVVPAGTTAADAVAKAGLPTSGPEGDRRGPRRRRPAARPGLGARARHRREPGGDRLAGRPERAAPLDRARARPGRAGRLPARPSSASARRSRTASTTTSTCPSRSSPRTCRSSRSGCRRSSRPGRRFRRRRYESLDEAKEELASEPYKLELVDIKGAPSGQDADRGDGGRRRRADHLRQRRPKAGKRMLGRPVPRSAPADAPG